MNNSKISVRLEPLGKIIRVSSGTPLKDILFQYGVEFPCGGKGTCGGCKVKVLKGHLPLDEKQSKLLKDGGFGDEYRLACKAVATQDVSLEIGQFDTFVLADNTSFHFTPKKDFGIAIDIGTTTLVAQLLNLETGQVKDAITALNPQSEYGVDIISRIQYAVFEKGHDKLKTLIWQEISKMVNKLIKRNSTKVTDIVLVGNTVMQHLFDGTDLTPLSAFPFETKEKDFSRFTSAELGLKTDPDTRITFIPSIGSFIGSDIMAGILASRMHESDSYIALIDLGTNGEIAVGNKNGIFCASTAAGPAFEGTNISMGMRATNGAISSVSKEGEKLHCHVIGNDSPRGICGSGLIDAVAVFIQEGKIDIGGKIIGNSKKLDLSYPVVLSQKDIREFQLAKGAVAAGIQILLKNLNISSGDIDIIYIAGAFGSFINIKNTVDIGLIEFPVEKIKKLGNSALIGAKMCLFLDEIEIQNILKITKHFSLETSPDFQDIFSDKLLLNY